MTPKEFEIAIRESITPAKTRILVNRAGAQGMAIIDTRTRRGEFTGGSLKSTGYSTKAMILTGSRGFRYESGSASLLSNSLSKSDYIWRVINGRTVPLLIGGYKKYREITGRRTDRVDLTFTGDMLRSLRYEVGHNAAVIRPGPDQMAKAAGTDAKREWMNLTNDEQDAIARALEQALSELSG
jgi:hypothetical protein